MIRSIAKTVAYSKAPRTTFTVLHPKRAVRLRKMKYDLRHAYAPRVAAVGAMALALPLGYMVGRGLANGSQEGSADARKRARLAFARGLASARKRAR